MSKLFDSLVVGQVYGNNFTFLGGERKGQEALFRCFCGKEKYFRFGFVLSGGQKSCGCLLKGNKRGYKHTNNLEIFSSDKHLGYICGLWSSDGSIGKNSSTLEIFLGKKDKETIAFLAGYLCKGIKILHRPKGLTGIKFTFPELKSYMLEMGITPKKSLTMKINLEGKSEEFLWYFLRGVIDGDGCVSIPQTKGFGGAGVTICSGSLSFLEQMNSLLVPFNSKLSTKRLGQLKTSTLRDGRKIIGRDVGQVSCRGAGARALAWCLPKDDFTMLRKTEKLNDLLNLGISRPKQGEYLDFFSEVYIGPTRLGELKDGA